MLGQELHPLVDVSQKAVWVTTHTPHSAAQELIHYFSTQRIQRLWTWSIADGFRLASVRVVDGETVVEYRPVKINTDREPLAHPLQDALHVLAASTDQFDAAAPVLAREDPEDVPVHVVILHDAAQFMRTLPGVPTGAIIHAAWRRFFEQAANVCAVVLAPPTELPPRELVEQFWTVRHKLPTIDELAVVVDKAARGRREFLVNRLHVAEALRGLSLEQAERALALSELKCRAYDPAAIWETKAKLISSSEAIEIVKPDPSLTRADVGGMDGALDCILQMLENRAFGKVRPRGVLVSGVAGAGKTHLANVVAAVSKWPIVRFKVEKTMNSLVGETEKAFGLALDTAEAMAPCLFFWDEVEKSMPKVGGSATSTGDMSGRLKTVWLTWQQNNEAPVFVFGAANHLDRMDGADLRRFDVVFFADLPTDVDRRKIWDLYLRKYLGLQLDQDLPLGKEVPDKDTLTGADIEKICRLASTMKLSTEAAARYVVPTAVSAKEEIAYMRDAAHDTYIDARTGEVYKDLDRKATTTLVKATRRVNPSNN
jgi:hypothetical protein